MPMSNKLNIALVCNPNRSVVVSACAGSGKTWLLVARLVRILLTGESPVRSWPLPLPAKLLKRCVIASTAFCMSGPNKVIRI